MPGFSKDTAPIVGEFGPVTDRHGEIDGYTVTRPPEERICATAGSQR
jgi:hypothetical protein